ncbi:MAG: 50S ribosomal protein L19e [Nanoarchaeota archaeon]|nr:50S ribosomal protein L19e [Nanoarchaeota archaeon]MBU1644473.1 50S ribosomal protein L19e [Nanoarchaeota archaeon]MBU1976477.1 50S ribosomal protein L19e [Nanoarchaeota archaeon]
MRNKKQVVAKIMKTSPYKVKFSTDALEDIKKAITRADFRGLIAVGKITKSDKNLASKAGARKNAEQKRKGRRKNSGSKSGSKFSVVDKKAKWAAKVRVQRTFLRNLKENELITKKDYRKLYLRSKGGFFRNKRHIKLYLKEQNLIQAKSPSTKVETEKQTK